MSLAHPAKKNLGQHFLISSTSLGRIVRAAELDGSDMVIEVGPGLGTLTRELALAAGRVIAVELDDKLASALRDEMAPFSHVSVLSGDILKLDIPSVVGSSSYKVVANLPYNITGAVLRLFLEAEPRPNLIVVTVQKEVAQSIVSHPGSMSLLGLSVQFYGHPEIVARIPPWAFYPPPKVSSAVVRIRVYARPQVVVDSPQAFFSLIRAGFAAPRKQIINSLALGLGLPKLEAEELLCRAAIDPHRRAETLDLEEWRTLYQVYSEAKASGALL